MRKATRNSTIAAMGGLVLIACVLAGSFAGAAAGRSDNSGGAQSHHAAHKSERATYRVHLRNRVVTTAHGSFDVRRIARGAAPTARVHFMLQFTQLPTEDEHQLIERDGVHLMGYLGSFTYVASAPAAWLKTVRSLPHARSALAFKTNDKVDPQIRSGKVPAWARTPGGVLLSVRLFDDVPLSEGQAIVKQFRGKQVAVTPGVKAITARFADSAVIPLLARQDAVQYVQAPSAPRKPASMSAAAATGAPTIWNPPYGINGAGQKVFVYDDGEVDARHPDFGNPSRVTDVPAAGAAGAYYGHHATHVGAIIAGSGGNSNGAPQGGATTLAFGTIAGTSLIVPNALLYWAPATWVGNTSNCVIPQPAPPTCPYSPAWQPGDTVRIGSGATAEMDVIAGWNSTFTGYALATPLVNAHSVGEAVQLLNVGASAGQYAGVAPGATIYSANGIAGLGSGTTQADFQGAVNAGATVANMSLGASAQDCATNGSYTSDTALFDKIVSGLLGSPISFTIAASNSRPNTAYANCVNYRTVSPEGSAKDAITVGALNGDDQTVASFSSFGPTQDGRVKPDLSAPGCTSGNEAGANQPGDGPGIVAADFRDLYQPAGGAANNPNGQWDDGTNAAANIAEPYATYSWECGTSMAAPAVAGAIADLRQDWIKAHGSNVPLAPATVKAILVQSADRPPAGPIRQGAGAVGALNGAAPAAGQPWTWPNFAEGFGQLNLKAAIDLVDSDKTADWIKTDQLAQANPAQTKTYKFYSSGANDVTATLAWDDPAGPPAAAKELQNQLNLTLTDPAGNVWQPWVANPVNPAAPPAADASTRGVDTLNNVQLVYAPKAAGIWTATVTGTAVTTAQAQKFTLVAPPVVNSISVGDTQANEGDSGTSFAYFTISRQQATDRAQSVDYATANGTASAGTDYTNAAGTATIPAGQLSTVVTVPIIPNTTVDPDRTFTFTISNPQPDQPITRAVATGTILDDDSGLQADIVGKTGQSIPSSGDTITSVQALVSINKKSNVAFSAGTSSTAGTGLFVGNGIDPARLINPSWTSRRFDAELQLNDNDRLIATDVLAGSPPSRHVRLWDTTTTDAQTNLASGGSFSSSYDAVLLAGLNDNNNYFYLGLSGSQWTIVTNSGESQPYDAVLRPWITNDGHIVYRAGNFTGDATNPPSPIVLDDTGFGSATTIACSGGCTHPGFTQLGRAPTATNDSQIVTFYGALTSPNPQAPQGPGIWASVSTANGRTLVKVAGIGDSGIASFEPTTRVAVNSTQATQRAVTVVFIAYDQAGHKGIYSSVVHLLPAQGQPFDPANPGDFKVDPPHRVVSVGDHIRGIGPVNDLQVWDPVNDHASGDIAFWVQSATVNAAVRVRSIETPLLFVPGVAGSQLIDHANSDEKIWLPSLTTSLLNMDDFLRTHLSLRPEDENGRDMRAKDVLRYLIPSVGYGAQYAPILDFLESKGYSEYKLGNIGENVDRCDTSQLADHPNLFIFPYDWRKSNTVNAARLNSYMQCIQSFYPGDKVNILTHSMGGLLTRRTILAYPSFADKVNTLTSVTPPWLGAPKLQYVLMTGDFIPGSVSGPGVYTAVQSLPGPQELMPSRAYYQVASGPGNVLPFGESGRNIDGDLPPTENNNELFDYSKMVDVMNFNDPRFNPGTTAMNFHDYSIAPGVGQDDWHNDPFSFQFNEIYGVQTAANTIGQTMAVTKDLCQTQQNPAGDTFANCRGEQTFALHFVSGDGTVPEISANRPGSLNPPNAKIIPFSESGSGFAGNAGYFEHTGILQNPDVQSEILDILQKNGGPPPPVPLRRRLSVKRAVATPNPAADAPENEVNVSIYGGSSFVVKDAAGNSTAPVLVDAQPSNIAGTVPNVSTYAIGAHDQLIRSFSQSALTTTFTATGGPTEIDVVVGPDAAPTSATRYMDVNVPAGAAVQVASSVGSPPQLQYDSNGDGTVDTTVQPTVAVTGAAAQDVTPPTLSISRVRKTDGTTDVTVAAADSGSGVSDIWYSTDGSTYFKYTGPVNVDPSAVQTLYAFSNDQAGNRSASANFKVGERVVDTPTALDVLAATDENQALQIPVRGFAPSGEPLTFVATQPKNGAVTISGSTISYTPNQYFFGTDTFTFTADDGYLVSEPATVTVTVRHVNQKPVITLAAPQTVDEGAAPASITATVWDPDGDTTTLKWSASLGRLTPNGTSATFAADDGPAAATVTLVATDSHGLSGTGQAAITVRNVAPKATVTTPASPYWGQPVSLSGSASDQGPADQSAGLSGTWAFGDGGTGAGFLASHTYAKAGTYTATLTATDKDGGAGTGSAAVTVKKRTATLAYTGATSAPFGFLTLQAKLTDTVDPATAQLGGHTVVFIVGTQSFVATTDSSGTASATPAPIAPGSYPVAVTLPSNNPAYTATAGRASIVVTRSLGTLTGTSLVFATGGGSGSLSVSSTSTGVTGSFSYTGPTLTVTATSLGPVGISADGHAAWLTGVDSAGRKLTIYLEDNGAGTSDVFKLSVNGVPQTGAGALTGGDVAITKTG